jgi:hypothetical protein
MNRKIIITSIIAIIALALVSTLLVARSVNSVESQLEAANKYITDGDYGKVHGRLLALTDGTFQNPYFPSSRAYESIMTY